MVPVLKLTRFDSKKIMYEEISNEEEFRVGCIKELIDIKHGNLYVDGFSSEELTLMLYNLCAS